MTRPPSHREQAAVFLLGAAVTRWLLDRLARRQGLTVPPPADPVRFDLASSPGVGRRLSEQDAEYRRRYGAHRPGLN